MRFMLPNFRIMQKKDFSFRIYQNLKITHADPDHLFLAITQNWAMRLFVGFVMQGHKCTDKSPKRHYWLYATLIMYWTPRERVPLPRWRLFWNLGTKYRFFVCIIKFKLASTLGPKSLQMYMISVQGVGEPFLFNVLDTKGRVWEGDSPVRVIP